MEPTHILLRYGEIFLKGKNKGTFENKLVDNIKKITKVGSVRRLRARYVLDYFENHGSLKNVFGLTSYSLAVKTEKEIESIKKLALSVLSSKKGIKSFKIETKRSDKRFPIKSPEINIEVGKYIEENSNLEFQLKGSDVILNIEINQEGVFIFTEIVRCFGGLPTGVEGRVNLLVENDASLLAGLLMMKRGVTVVPVRFDECDISLLGKFSPQKIESKKVDGLSELNGDVLVVGDNFDNYKKRETESLVLRPLIGYSKEEIKEELGEFKI
tara:strand:+ start:822 stop:1631 length:810 start_codon:yes stop_codon:yes gene_type:complete